MDTSKVISSEITLSLARSKKFADAYTIPYSVRSIVKLEVLTNTESETETVAGKIISFVTSLILRSPVILEPSNFVIFREAVGYLSVKKNAVSFK